MTASVMGAFVVALDELLLLHDRHLGLERTFEHHAKARSRQRPKDPANRWSYQYSWTRLQFMENWQDLSSRAIDVADPALRAWQSHAGEPGGTAIGRSSAATHATKARRHDSRSHQGQGVRSGSGDARFYVWACRCHLRAAEVCVPGRQSAGGALPPRVFSDCAGAPRSECPAGAMLVGLYPECLPY
jgi:hypothetical protein